MKYKILKTFRDGATWYKQGKIIELAKEKASEFIRNNLILPSIDDSGSILKPVVETAEKPTGTETATTRSSRGRPKGP